MSKIDNSKVNMSPKNKLINPGGVNGTGKGVVNINSKDYKGLQQAILEHSKNQTPTERITYELISLKYQMEHYFSETNPEEKITVGEFLRKHLDAIGITNKLFAKYINIEESNLSSILKGRRKMNLDLAFKLGHLFPSRSNLWLMIQSKNELLALEKQEPYTKYNLEELIKKTG